MVALQNDVNSFIDSSKSATPIRQGKQATTGMERKDGLFPNAHDGSQFHVGVDVEYPLIVPTKQMSQLCYALRHLTRCQHRSERDRCTTRICTQTDVPGTRYPT